MSRAKEKHQINSMYLKELTQGEDACEIDDSLDVQHEMEARQAREERKTKAKAKALKNIFTDRTQTRKVGGRKKISDQLRK